ncbi:hypothetical protein [uncultured Clostridium sp.]|nr:hypothetical protein [uncultured Clostridium sp.]
MKQWVNECNGRDVKIEDSQSGNVRIYTVFPDWCKCVGKEE